MEPYMPAAPVRRLGRHTGQELAAGHIPSCCQFALFRDGERPV
jgi:hypothetical protein